MESNPPIPSYAEFVEASEGPYVKRVVSPCGRLCLFNYTRQCTFDSAWSPVTLWSRGIVFEIETGRRIATPFPKFFNTTEPEAAWVAGKGPPTYVVEKLDGSLGISFVYDGEVWFTTRGSFTSVQSKAARRLWREMYRNPHHITAVTYMWEIIASETTNVVAYGGEERLVLLGGRYPDGTEHTNPMVESHATYMGVHRPQLFKPSDIESLKAAADAKGHNFEGFVLMWADGADAYARAKVKGVEYRRVHRLLQGLTDRTIGDLWYAEAVLGPEYPEETRMTIESQWRTLDSRVTMLKEATEALATAHPSDTRKAFVQSVGVDHPLFTAAIKLFTGAQPDYRLLAYKQTFGSNPR